MFVSSCYPQFENGLPVGRHLRIDKEITGSWFRSTENDKQQLLIYSRQDDWVDIIYIYDIESKTSRDGVNVLIFEGYTSVISKDKFLCFRLRKKDVRKTRNDAGSQEFSFLIVNYNVSDKGDLIIKSFSVEKAKQLVKQGKLKGEIFERDPAEGRFFPSVIITSSSEKLAAVLSEEGVEQFIEEGPYGLMTFSRSK